MWCLTSNANHTWCLEQGGEGAVARLAIHRKYGNPIYDDAQKCFSTEKMLFDLVPAGAVLGFRHILV